jgi:hypothetical protein
MEGYIPQELLDAPVCPTGCEYLWGWFLRLNSTRNSGFGVSSITESELGSFFRNRGIHPEEWEIDLLLRLDRIAVENAAKKGK